MAKIGDLFLGLLVDPQGDLKAQVKKEAEAAGTEGGKALSSKMGLAIKAGSAAIAAGFAVATKGAMEMERAQGNFQAATGRSREEAVQFSKDMNGLVGTAATVGRSFEEIADTGTLVAQQMGTTGEETTQLTEDILAFSKVTGMDATTAVTGLDDAMDAWGLTTADAVPVMDTLVAGVQEFGGTAESSLGLLNSLAPALQAANIGWEEAAGMINLFNRAGVDANVTATAFGKALQTVESPEELNQLIEDIAATEDPFARAQLAAETFGAKAGPKLALALADSGGDLSAFQLDVSETAGAVDQAADDMLTTSDKFRMLGDKIGAAFRGFGSEVGPIATGLASMVGLVGALPDKMTKPLTDGMSTMLGKVAASAPIKLAGGAIGTAVGGAQAIAHQIAATGAAAIKTMAVRIAAMSIPLAGAGTTVGTAVGSAMGAATAAAYLAAPALVFLAPMLLDKMHIAGPETQARASFDGQVLMAATARGFLDHADELRAAALAAYDQTFAATGSTDAAIKAGADAADAYAVSLGLSIDRESATMDDWWRTVGERAASATAAGFSSSGEIDAALIESATEASHVWVDTYTGSAAEAFNESEAGMAEDLRETMVSAGTTAMADSEAAFRALGQQTTDALGAGMTAAEATHGLMNDVNTLKDALEKYLSPREQALELIGSDYIKTLKRGMNSEDENLRLAAQNIAINSIATIEDAGLTGAKGQKGLKQIGILYDQLLASGMEAEEIKAKLRAAGVSETIISGLDGPAQRNDATDSGENIAQAFIAGIARFLSSEVAERRVHDAANDATEGLHGQSPPKVGPLRFIDKWGENVGKAWLGGVGKGINSGGLASSLTMPSLFGGSGALTSLPMLTGSGSINLHHTVDLKGAPPGLSAGDVAGILNTGAESFVWNLEHALGLASTG